MLQVAILDAGERLDVPHFGRADVDLASLAEETRLPVAAEIILLDADRKPLALRDLENNLRVTRRVAILLAVVGHGHQFAAALPGADAFDNQPHEAGDFQTDVVALER